jgi:hypothetical protein
LKGESEPSVSRTSTMLCAAFGGIRRANAARLLAQKGCEFQGGHDLQTRCVT